jgi:predicted secreted Zn-dependent protease
VTLPRHEFVNGLEGEARANWDRLVTHIADHEQRHVDIELQHARELEAQIRAMPTASNCSALQYEIDGASRALHAQARRAHLQFHIEDAARRQAERKPISENPRTSSR